MGHGARIYAIRLWGPHPIRVAHWNLCDSWRALEISAIRACGSYNKVADNDKCKMHFESKTIRALGAAHKVARSAETSTVVGRTRECIPLGSYHSRVGNPNTIRLYFSQLVLRCIPAPRTPPIRRICAGTGFY